MFENNKFFVFQDLKGQLICEGDVLGKKFDIQIKNIKGKILLPKLNHKFLKIDTNQALINIEPPVCPYDNKDWFNEINSLGNTQWGCTLSYPSETSIITKIMFIFENLEDEVQLIYDEISNWVTRFFDIKEILTGKPSYVIEDNTIRIHKDFGIVSTDTCVYQYKDEEMIPVKNKKDKGLSLTATIGHKGLNQIELNEIIEYTNQNKNISFPYKCFLEGIRAFDNEDYIKTIAICSPALEFTLKHAIERFCKNKNIYFVKKLFEKYKMLKGYFALANDIQMPLPTSDYSIKLVKLRNKVIHEGYSPTKNEAKDYLDNIKLYLHTFEESFLNN